MPISPEDRQPLPDEWYGSLANEVLGPTFFEPGSPVYERIMLLKLGRPTMPLGLMYQLVLTEACFMCAYHFEHDPEASMYGPDYLDLIAQSITSTANRIRLEDAVGPNGMN
ncbi:MAG: hypothetical protein E6R03_12680 [Hyphomicrobiaceae bacterium]|nr:MAG: hypothetical protein E6R03_12680 [Hyphomicrobiaceae bacterium]